MSDLRTDPIPREPSLSEVHRSVGVGGGSWIRRFLAFAGPGYMVSVGYMDPGNWATDLAGGSQYGYALLWVILVANLMAMLLQSLCVKLGIVTGLDLAQACRQYYKKPASIALWILCEIAIIACELAEVIGSAIALNLLFGIPLMWGVIITAADVLLLIGLMNFGFRKLEAVVLVMVLTIGVCFGIQMFWAQPNLGDVGRGLVGFTIPDNNALLIALGILGATVMPHNLYLHSSLVQTRKYDESPEGKRTAIRFNVIDVILALACAFFVNAAILILAAAVFHTKGIVVEELGDAHKLLSPLLGGASATLFAVALLASGQSATITGTLAGQIVMEGFLQIKVKPWIRRLTTRLIAIVPALLLVKSTGGTKTVELLTLSQVVLSLQLSFAIFPLVMFTSSAKRMGEFKNHPALIAVSYAVCTAIATLNVYFLYTLSVDHNLLWLFWSLTLSALAFSAWVKWGYKGSDPKPSLDAQSVD
jgi:manganese transport protein